MACREDARSWYKKERRMIEDIKLIWATFDEALETFTVIVKLWRGILSEVGNLLEKMKLSDHLFKLVAGKGDEQKQRIQEIWEGRQVIMGQLRDFYFKFDDERTRLAEESKSWQDYLLKKTKSFDELKRLKVEERKALLRKNAVCLSLFISGKRIFEGFKKEWDDIKPGFDQSFMGFLKDLVVISKEPADQEIEE